MAQDLLDRLARQSDATFVSHVHGDHASAAFAQLFVDHGKPVIAPEGLWSGQPRLTGSFTRLSRDSNSVQHVLLRSGKTLAVSVYLGHQGRVPNNVYVIRSPDGFTIVHTGDQAAEEAPGGDFDWIAQIGGRHKVDILLPNCWTTNIQRMARGVNPQLIITGHENEMGHTVDHREDYTQTYNHLFGVRYPFLVMAWGESYHYLRPSETQRAGLRSGR
jgi:glyoxylase-like metal-dependent hydrolase (beta-lactamase superfamily II)